MNFKHKRILLSAILILYVLFMCIQINNTALAKEGLSNKLIGWGIKRVKDHKQPELGAENKRLIEQYNGMALGNKDSKNVYLTFDLGYEAGYTDKILDILKENDVTATFFITGHYLNTSEDLVRKMINNGNIVGNHTVNHYSMPSISDEKIADEINNLHKSMYERLGYEMKYVRPPKGEFSERTLNKCNELGYTTVMWSLAYDDWDENKQGREDYGKQKILDNIHNGAILLLHATSKDNMNILDYCIKEIKNMGYEFKSLDEFVR